MSMNGKLAWGILSTGRIAGVFAKSVAASKSGGVVAVGSRTQAAADAFGKAHNVPRRHGSYGALLADPEVQAVYIATPHPLHAEWAIKAAEAGKHILCEKPLTLTAPEAMAVIEAARRNDVFLMEAFVFRGHPQTEKLVELIRGKVIGDVRLIQATLSFQAHGDPEGRLFNNALGGGGILDVGCYCTAMARLIAGVAQSQPFADPLAVQGAGKVGETRVDEYAACTMLFPGQILAQLATGIRLNQENVLRIFGTNGSILVPQPWFCGGESRRSTIVVTVQGEPAPREITISPYAGPYSIEADTVARHIADRQAPSPAMSWDDTLGNMRTLDRWRQAVGVVYDAELPAAWKRTAANRPLRRPSKPVIPSGRIAGLDLPVSRLIMGAMAANSIGYASVLYDDFVERGGNAFDTGYVYGGGNCERLLGQWVRNRRIRDRVVIMAKGAHTPFCTPEFLTSQLFESLERMQTDYADVYMMHRDNLDVPAGEFIDVMNEHGSAGRIRTFGVSNWTLKRVDQANAYAKRKGLKGLVAVSNNFTLARMLDPVWAGALASSDAESRAWFAKRGIPCLAWSSQARGFYARGNPDSRAEPELVRCWYSADNFERLARARELGRERGFQPIEVALAYVLNQPFEVFAMIGPATPTETSSSLRALELKLTPEELEWLNLERDTR